MLQSTESELDLEIPRDRYGNFETQIVRKRERRREGFRDKIIALNARGLSNREIQVELTELCGVEISLTLITNVTNSVLEEVQAYQTRPFDTVYHNSDCLFVKSLQEGSIRNKVV
ncbi:MAG: transposase [Candidatus Thiodiazotropha sp.]